VPQPFSSPEKLGSRDILRLLARSWPFIRPYKRHLRYLFLLVAAGLPPALLALSLYPIFFDVVGNGHALTAGQDWLLHVPIGATRHLVLWRACIVAGLAGMVWLPIGLGSFAYGVWILQRISNLFRVNLYTRMQELGLRFHSEEKIGDAIFRMFQDSAAIPHVINGLVLQPIVWLPVAIGVLAWLAYSNYTIAAIAAALIPAEFALAWAFSGPLRRAFRQARESSARATTTIEETLASITAVKAFNTEADEAARYARDNWDAFIAARRARLLMVTYRVINGSTRALAYTAVIYIGAHQVLGGGRAGLSRALISLGLFQAALSAFRHMSRGTGRLTDLWGSLQDVGVALARVFEMLDKVPEREAATGHEPVQPVRESVVFDRCGFSYDGRVDVLSGLSLEARVGELTAIAGESGAGKSTLIALVLRFFDPTSGRILLDGRDIRDLDLAAYRDQFSVALQENPLFTATMRDNIVYGRPEASSTEVAAALELAQLSEFTASLPAGLDTMLGEKGAKLSEGQAQRIGIARAILRDAPILLLDEPTSALDARSEERFLAALRRWVSERPDRRMVLIATHRATTAAMADRTYRIEAGKLAATEAPRPDLRLVG
jgi:ABC-type multidrug transport system fused ATPase/permease subunit